MVGISSVVEEYKSKIEEMDYCVYFRVSGNVLE